MCFEYHKIKKLSLQAHEVSKDLKRIELVRIYWTRLSSKLIKI